MFSVQAEMPTKYTKGHAGLERHPIPKVLSLAALREIVAVPFSVRQPDTSFATATDIPSSYMMNLAIGRSLVLVLSIPMTPSGNNTMIAMMTGAKTRSWNPGRKTLR